MNASNRGPVLSFVTRQIRRLLRDEAAASAAIIAISLSSMVGLVGMGVETGTWFSERRQYQSAADAGAIAGALQMVSQLNGGAVTAALDTTSDGSAWKEAVRNGATNSEANIAVSQLASPTRARVELTHPKTTMLAAIAFPNGVTITNVAEATVESLGSPCITALGTSGTVITVQGGATLNAPNCIVTSNSTANGTSAGNSDPASINVLGNSTLNAAQIQSAGSLVQNGTTNVEAPLTGMDATSNPFSSLPDPSTTLPPTTGCVSVGPTMDGGTGKRFCSSGNGNITLANGTFSLSGVLYVNNGNFTIGPNAIVTTGSAGVTVIMTGDSASKIGSISVTADATHHVTLSASTSGTYKGLVFYQDPDAVSPANSSTSGNGVNSFNGGASQSMSITGAIYMPKQTVNFQGNASTTCMLIVALYVNFSGTSSLDTTGCGGLLNLPTIYTAKLTL